MAQQDQTLQPNWSHYQTAIVPNANPMSQNAAAARAAEASISNCLGAGWGEVGGSSQAQANPKGVGSLPRGATGVKTPIRAGGRARK